MARRAGCSVSSPTVGTRVTKRSLAVTASPPRRTAAWSPGRRKSLRHQATERRRSGPCDAGREGTVRGPGSSHSARCAPHRTPRNSSQRERERSAAVARLSSALIHYLPLEVEILHAASERTGGEAGAGRAAVGTALASLTVEAGAPKFARLEKHGKRSQGAPTFRRVAPVGAVTAAGSRSRAGVGDLGPVSSCPVGSSEPGFFVCAGRPRAAPSGDPCEPALDEVM